MWVIITQQFPKNPLESGLNFVESCLIQISFNKKHLNNVCYFIGGDGDGGGCGGDEELVHNLTINIYFNEFSIFNMKAFSPK